MADKFVVHDNMAHEPAIYGVDLRENETEYYLYSVTLWDAQRGVFIAPVLVLAPSPEDAISQATCQTKEIENKMGFVAPGSRAERVEFLIRGFGKAKF